jgi:hypothetical protein
MKKKLVIILLVILILSFAACKSSEVEAVSAPVNKEIEFDFDVLTSELMQINYVDNEGTEKSLLGELKVLSDDEVLRILQIDTSLFSEHYFARHSNETKASLVAIVKPANGDDDKVKSEMYTFVDMYLKQFESYFPSEVKIIEDYYSIDKGEYIIYTISDDNQSVINAINKSKK